MPVHSRWSTFGVLLLAACSLSREPDAASAGFPEAAVRQRAATPVQEVSASSPDAGFTSVASLDVDSRGRIYVADTYQQRVVVLAPDGQVLRTFGRRGSGPDEFRSLQSLQILPGDSVLVYDPTQGRTSVFAPDSGRAAYVARLSTNPWRVRRTQTNDAILALFRPTFAFRPGADFSGRRDRVRLLDLYGGVRQELLSVPSKPFLVAGASVTPHPFGAEGFALLDSQDRLHFVWSDTLGATTRDLSGNLVGSFRIEYAAPPLTREDVDHALSGFGSMRSTFEPALTDSTPARWPAVRSALLDDRDRLWMALSGSLSRPTEWAAFTTDGAYLGSMIVPAGSEVRLIRGESVYAERIDDDDVAHVVVYRMARPIR